MKKVFVLLIVVLGLGVLFAQDVEAKRASERFVIATIDGDVQVEASSRSGRNAWSQCVYFENILGGDYLGHYGEPLATGDLPTFCADNYENRID